MLNSTGLPKVLIISQCDCAKKKKGKHILLAYLAVPLLPERSVVSLAITASHYFKQRVMVYVSQTAHF